MSFIGKNSAKKGFSLFAVASGVLVTGVTAIAYSASAGQWLLTLIALATTGLIDYLLVREMFFPRVLKQTEKKEA